jgi:hypothetical protein
MDGEWHARTEPVAGLVTPVRVDARGEGGPTRGQTQTSGWRQTTRGFWVRTDTDSTRVEQRILEQSMRLGPEGAVTGWAALCLAGAAYFDGTAPAPTDGVDSRGILPVPLASPDRQLASSSRVLATRSRIPEGQRTVHHGVACTTVERALFDEVRRLQPDLRAGVTAIDMTCAARLTSILRFRRFVAARSAARHAGFVARALDLASEWSRSPRETWMRLLWVVVAGFPTPRCNRPLWSKHGGRAALDAELTKRDRTRV